MKEASPPRAFKCIDIYQSGGEDAMCFEMVVGTVDGQIFHAELEYNKNVKESITVNEPFTFMLELVDTKAILDIKIASFSYE